VCTLPNIIDKLHILLSTNTNFTLLQICIGRSLDYKPMEYKWPSPTGYDTVNSYYGFSAQNIQLTHLEAVSENKHRFLTLSDRPLLAVVINAVQELWEIVTGNTEKIDTLESRIETLEAALDVTPSTNNNTTPEPEDPPPTEEPTASFSDSSTQESASTTEQINLPNQEEPQLETQTASSSEETTQIEEPVVETTPEPSVEEPVSEEVVIPVQPVAVPQEKTSV
jgi:hypothetical protein